MSAERLGACRRGPAGRARRRRRHRRGRLALGARRRDPRSRRRVGSGKTTTALALLGYADPACGSSRGEVVVAGETLAGWTRASSGGSVAALVSYVPQDPGNALNPALRIGARDRGHARRARADRSGSVRPPRSPRAPARPTTSSCAATRTSSRAGSSSGSRSRWRSSASRRSWCWTSRRPASTSSPRRASSTRSAGSGASAGSRWSTSRTTSRWSRRSPTGSRSCTPAGSSRRAPRPRARAPRHPYTRGLVASIPDHLAPRRLRGMPGVAVGVGERPPGCAFAPRCPQRSSAATQELPPLEEIGAGRRVRCFEWRRTPARLP